MGKRLTVGLGVTSAIILFGLIPARSSSLSPSFPPANKEPAIDREGEFRDDVLRRAEVWKESDPSRVDFTRNPADSTGGELRKETVSCRFLPQPAKATTPKFRCVLANGDVIKVKYGHTGEIHAELAASRLLTALGFGADDMYLVPRVRCYGCPRLPFHSMWVLDRVHLRERVAAWLPEDRYTEFEWVAVEREFDGVEVIEGDREGWAWYELDRIDPSRGASLAEVDALRLAAALIVHWDNKAANQRLVCRSPSCDEAWAIVQDLGATFGPNKVDLDSWEATPVWHDRSRCMLSMTSLPYRGSTFPDVKITEAGRQLLARQLRALSDQQTHDLFAAARFREFAGGHGRAADPNAWADVLKRKIAEIADGAPCPQ